MLTVTNGAEHDWANMPLHEMAIGNAADCDLTLRCWRKMRNQMKPLNVSPIYDKLLKEVTVALGEVENRGMKVDIEYLKELDETLGNKLEESAKELNNLSKFDKELNPNSTKEIADLLFTKEGFGLTPTMVSEKTKAPSITEEHLNFVIKGLAASHPAKVFIEKLLAYKTLSKQYKTYVKGVEAALENNGNGRIYSQYNFAATVTGRLSCSKYSAGRKKEQSKGVSFHTLPRTTADGVNLRKLMLSDSGKSFIAADFSQAELRVLAHCSSDANLIDAFKSGEDLHTYTASLVFGKDLEEVTKEERQVAKSCIFLIVYGGSYKKLAEQIGKSDGYAKDIFARFQAQFPGIFKFMKVVNKYTKANGYSMSLFGRRRNLPNVNSPITKYQYRALRQGLNFVIQSSTSDMVLNSLLNMQKKIKELGMEDVEILATVHDSIEVQCDKENTEVVAKLIKDVMEDISYLKTKYNMDFKVPMKVDVEVGDSFGSVEEVHFDSNRQPTNVADLI
tara:strand:+ start:3375 stop:4889 length:1515 start_codon:yes stop_codon:yes gene_type:complete